MKKIIDKILLSVILLLPINTLACPHIDLAGEYHLQFYNLDYTEMTMMYPLQNYLYGKTVPMSIENGMIVSNETDILTETFGFSLALDTASFLSFYWFTDESLEYATPEDLNIKTTIEGLENQVVSSLYYNLDINLNNTFDESRKFITDEIDQMYYNINVENISKNSNTSYHTLLNANNITIIQDTILSIEAEYVITDIVDYYHNTENKAIRTLYDPIEVQIKGSESSKDVVAMNLDDNLTQDNFIDVIYDNGMYKFEIENEGTYVVVEKNTSLDLKETNSLELKNDEPTSSNNTDNDYYNDIDHKETEEKNNSTIYIFAGISIILIIGTLILFSKIKKSV